MLNILMPLSPRNPSVVRAKGPAHTSQKSPATTHGRTAQAVLPTTLSSRNKDENPTIDPCDGPSARVPAPSQTEPRSPGQVGQCHVEALIATVIEYPIWEPAYADRSCPPPSAGGQPCEQGPPRPHQQQARPEALRLASQARCVMVHRQNCTICISLPGPAARSRLARIKRSAPRGPTWASHSTWSALGTVDTRLTA